MEAHENNTTIETDVELPERFARWARLYTNAQNATGSGSDDATYFDDVVINHAKWEYNYFLDGEPLEETE